RKEDSFRPSAASSSRLVFPFMQNDPIQRAIRESIATKERLVASCVDHIRTLCDEGVACLARGGKILLCGNGGSSCDAAHAAGELVGWFMDKRRKGYPAIAL